MENKMKMVAPATKENVMNEVKNNLIENFKDKELNELYLEQTIGDYDVFINYQGEDRYFDGVFEVISVSVWSPKYICDRTVRTRTEIIKTRLINTIINNVEDCIDSLKVSYASDEILEFIDDKSVNPYNENMKVYCHVFCGKIKIDITTDSWSTRFVEDYFNDDLVCCIGQGASLDEDTVKYVEEIKNKKEDIINIARKYREAA